MNPIKLGQSSIDNLNNLNILQPKATVTHDNKWEGGLSLT